MRLRSCLFVAILLVSSPVYAAPILTTVSCDSTGEYTCLTSLENFQVGEEVYNASFVPTNIIDAFDVPGETRDELLDGFKPLKNAVFWDDQDGAETFSAALAALVRDNDIDGFLCAGRCDPPAGSQGLPYDYTYIPVHLQTISNFEIGSCFVRQGFFCTFNPGSNTQNWAVISRVPEPATVATFGLGLLSITARRVMRSSRLSKRPRD